MSEEHSVPESYRDQVHSKIKSHVISSGDGIDVSDSFNENTGEYIDVVHLTQSGREVVARKIFESNILRDAIKSCTN